MPIRGHLGWLLFFGMALVAFGCGDRVTAEQARARGATGTAATGKAGVSTYPDGKTRAFANIAGNEHIKSDLGAIGGSVDKPSATDFIIFGPDKVSRVAFSKIAKISFITEQKAYTSGGGYTSQYSQVVVSTKDGKKETFLVYDDQVALHIEWADSIAVSAYQGRDLKGVVFAIK